MADLTSIDWFAMADAEQARALTEANSAEANWLRTRRRELAVEWSTMPIPAIEAGVREVQDIAWELGINTQGKSKRQMIAAIRNYVLEGNLTTHNEEDSNS